MPVHRLLAALLLVLLVVNGTAAWAGVSPMPGGSRSVSWWGIVGAYGVPFVLAGALVRRQRWPLMAAVIYGTIGLAFDIATVVQVLPREPEDPAALAVSLARGFVNLAVITLGWRGFLSDWPVPSSPA